MSKIFYLAKVFFLEQFSMTFSKISPYKRARNFTLIGIVSLLVMFSLGVTTFGQFIALRDVGKPEYILYIGLVYVGMLSLIFFFFNFQSSFLGSKDFEFLAGLPLTNFEIIGGKLIALLINSYIIQTIILLPAIVIFFIGNAASILTILFLIVGFLLLPIFNFLISALFGLLISFIAHKSSSVKKTKKNLSYIFLFILVFAFLIINYAGINNVLLGKEIPLIMHIMLPIQSLLFIAINQANWLLFLAYVAANVLFAFLTIYSLAKNYFKFNQNLTKEKQKKRKKLTFEKTSVLRNLFGFELKQFLSKPLYVFNAAFGAVVMTIAAVGVPIAFLVLKNSVGGLPDLFQAGPVLALFIAFVVIAMGLMGCSTSISVSIEGKSFYYKKSLPIKFEVQMLAKILINMLLSIPSLIFMLTTFPIMIYLNFYISDILLLVLLIISTGVLVSTMGLFINLMFIKLDWINEMVVVKQSMSVFLAVLVSLLLVIGSIFLIDKAITIMSISLSLVLINASYLLLSGLFWHLIVTIGKKKYNKQV